MVTGLQLILISITSLVCKIGTKLGLSFRNVLSLSNLFVERGLS